MAETTSDFHFTNVFSSKCKSHGITTSVVWHEGARHPCKTSSKSYLKTPRHLNPHGDSRISILTKPEYWIHCDILTQHTRVIPRRYIYIDISLLKRLFELRIGPNLEPLAYKSHQADPNWPPTRQAQAARREHRCQRGSENVCNLGRAVFTLPLMQSRGPFSPFSSNPRTHPTCSPYYSHHTFHTLGVLG